MGDGARQPRPLLTSFAHVLTSTPMLAAAASRSALGGKERGRMMRRVSRMSGSALESGELSGES